MNRPLIHPRLTQAADGLERFAFTVEDVDRLEKDGLLDDLPGYELIDGEIVPMASEFDRHARARMRLLRRFMAALPEDQFFVASEASLILSKRVEFKPDLHVFAADLISHEVRGPEVLLAVELASSSHHRDFAAKKPIYAREGVRELWLLDLDARTGLVCAAPGEAGYTSETPIDADTPLTPGLLPGPTVRLSDLLA